ncbi:MAG: tRNA (adenosine(37)-N6)-threonylcarbamoyltransferase complex transferase subunit TsaD [Patescibacteria group bacterium]|nr:tRNA (adenosine(37)-N6)-threonylcarbamoyltransferase complex transferase subunit TsaD [Patescibacteria group bacterium]
MYILGLESSCDESAASIIKFNNAGNFKVLSDVISSQITIHQKYGGVVPEIAAREHVLTILPTIDECFKKSKIKPLDISAIALTSGPGLITSLISASETAKALALVWQKPIIPINHIEGHIYSAFIENQKKIKFPALILTVSGGHNILAVMEKNLKYKIIGQTLDDAAGEAFDKAAKMMGLGYPGGPIISQMAKKYLKENKNPVEIELPRPMLGSPNLNFSFSGLKTALLYKLKKDKNWKKKIPQYCYSFQKAVIDTLIFKTIKAIKKYQVKTIVLVGGVSANMKLKEELEKKIKQEFKNINLVYPSLKYTGDNATMIALAGIYHFLYNKKNIKNYKKIKINSNLNLS